MMLATVSKVEDIGKSLDNNGISAAPEGSAAPGPMRVPPRFPPNF